MEDVPERKDKTMWNIKRKVQGKANDFKEAHPNTLAYGLYAVGFAITIPIAMLQYKYLGRCVGKATAKELVKAGLVPLK